MLPTTQEEMQSFCTQMTPVFLEYLRNHMSAIEQVELATTRKGIVPFPATQVIGGVVKTVRVPLSLLTEELDAMQTEAEEMAVYAKEQAEIAKAQAAAALEAAGYAGEQGRYAKAQGDGALAAKNTVTGWFDPFRDDAEHWYADAAAAEQQRVAAELTRVRQEGDRVAAERLRDAQEKLRIAAELERAAAELDRASAEVARAKAELLRKEAEARREEQEEVRLDGTFRQNAATGNWERLDQRTGEWEDTGNSWQGGLLAYRFYTDWRTGRCHVVKNSIDKVGFSISNGRLKATYNG